MFFILKRIKNKILFIRTFFITLRYNDLMYNLVLSIIIIATDVSIRDKLSKLDEKIIGEYNSGVFGKNICCLITHILLTFRLQSYF